MKDEGDKAKINELKKNKNIFEQEHEMAKIEKGRIVEDDKGEVKQRREKKILSVMGCKVGCKQCPCACVFGEGGQDDR